MPPGFWEKVQKEYAAIIICTSENPRATLHFLSYFNVWKLFFGAANKTFIINRCFCLYNYFSFMGIHAPLTIHGKDYYINMMVSQEGRQALVDEAARMSPLGQVVEIGRAFGGSAAALALAINDSTKKVHSIDIKTDPLFQEFTSFYRVRDRITCYDTGSYRTYLHFKKRFGQALSFVFIDGNHEEDAIALDIRLWSELLLPGGVICLHEYGHNDINQSTRVIHQEIINKQKLFTNPKQVRDLFFATKI